MEIKKPVKFLNGFAGSLFYTATDQRQDAVSKLLKTVVFDGLHSHTLHFHQPARTTNRR